MQPVQPQHRDLFEDLKGIRAEALEHARMARNLSRRRADLITELTQIGYAQADIARELGVSRQAVQKMAASR